MQHADYSVCQVLLCADHKDLALIYLPQPSLIKSILNCATYITCRAQASVTNRNLLRQICYHKSLTLTKSSDVLRSLQFMKTCVEGDKTCK